MKSSAARAPIDILVVEDHKPDVRLAIEAMKEIDVPNRVHVVGDGVEALSFLRRRGEHKTAPDPDVVLLDLNLPRKDGREVFREIRDDDDIRAAVIVVSGAKDERAAEYLHAGAMDYVVKGSLERLASAVETALRIRLPQTAQSAPARSDAFDRDREHHPRDRHPSEAQRQDG
jgi:CheY-like chemotaxis protein